TAHSFVENLEEMFSILFIRPVRNLSWIDRPVALFSEPARPDKQVVGRWQSEDILKERLLLMSNGIGKVLGNHALVRLAPEHGICEKWRQLGAEEKSWSRVRVVEGLQSQEISRTKERPLMIVPNGEGKVSQDMTRTL